MLVIPEQWRLKRQGHGFIRFFAGKTAGKNLFSPFFSPSIVDTAMAYLTTRFSNSTISPRQIGVVLLVVFFACWVACALPQSLSPCAKPEGL